jgi:hypothetical protein
MMEEEQITADLNLLAGDMTSVYLDLERVMDTARTKTHRRYALAATSAGTLALAVVAAAVALPFSHGGQAQAETGSAAHSSSTTVAPPSSQQNIDGTIDAESTKLTGQLRAAQASIIPSSFTRSADQYDILRVDGAPVPPLEFGHYGYPAPAHTPYAMDTLLTDANGAGRVSIAIEKLPAGSPVPPCVPGPNIACGAKTLQDGTKVQITTYKNTNGVANNTIVEAVRPDGTHIIANSDTLLGIPNHRPTPALGETALIKFATVFTY